MMRAFNTPPKNPVLAIKNEEPRKVIIEADTFHL